MSLISVKILVFVIYVHHCIGGLPSPENDSLDTTGPGIPSVTSGQVSGSLRNILNQESLVRFAMVQRIQKLVLDMAEVRGDFKDLQRKLIDIEDELKTKDQRLEKENAELKQTIQAIYTRYPIDDFASTDIESVKNETLNLNMKYNNLSLENNAFQIQLNDMNGQMKKVHHLSARLHIVEESVQNMLISVNASIENIREDLNTSCTLPPVTESSELFSGSQGREFLILFMRNHPAAKGSSTIYVTSESGATANLSSSPKLDATVKSAFVKRLNITVDSKFTLPFDLTCEYGKVEPKAVILQTSKPSTVTIFDSFYATSNDATLIIPTHKLSKKYVVSSTQPDYSSSPDYYSQFALGALYDGTTINITFKMKNKSPLSLLGRTYTDGEGLLLTLERLETFQVGHTTDLSGTVITSSKPVAVFSGNRCNELKDGCSHMLTQLPPVSELDNQYIVPLFYNNAGTLIQVISESATSVNCSVGDRVSTWLLGETEYKNVEVTSNEIAVIVSDRPVLVTAFGMGKPYHPYMTVIPGMNQYLNYYKVVVPDGYKENFLCVFISSDFVKSLRINGYTVDHYKIVYQSLTVVEDKTFHVSILQVKDGRFELRTLDNSRFGLLVYGHRDYDGYGFAGNFVLN